MHPVVGEQAQVPTVGVAVAGLPSAEVSSPNRRGLRWMTMGTVGGLLAAWYVVLSRGGWAYDDNLSFVLARLEPLRTYLNSELFGHWGAGYRLAFRAIASLMPIDYRWIMAAELLVLGASALLLARIVEMLVGGRWRPMLAAGYLAVSVFLIRSLEWPSTGLQAIPTIACDLVCLWSFLHYRIDRSVRWVVISAGSVAVGLLFYEKPALMPLFVLALRLLVLGEEVSPRRMVAAVWRERALWGAYAAVLLGYVLTRELAGAGSLASAGIPTSSQWLHMYWLMWAKSVVPAAFGLALVTPSVNGWQLAIGVALEGAVLAAIVVSIRRQARAWRAWVALAVCILAIGLVIGLGRVRMLGPGVATDQRYLIELAWLIPLFVLLAFSPLTPVSRPTDTRLLRGPVPTNGRLAAGVVALLSALYVSVSVATAAHWEDGWAGVPARAWETRVQTTLSAVSRMHTRPAIVDGSVPGFIVQPAFTHYNLLSLVLPLYGPAARVAGPLAGPLATFTPGGEIEPARIAPVLAPRTVPNCGRDPAGELRFQERLRPPSVDVGRLYLIVSYRTAGPAKLPLFVDSGTGFSRAPNYLVALIPGARKSLAWLGENPPTQLLLSAGPLGYVCLRSVELVTVNAAG